MINEIQQHSGLLIEDSIHDFTAIQRAFRQAGFEGRIEHCQKGETALAYLDRIKGQSLDTDNDLPSFILLDLNLPAIDGISVLKSIKADSLLMKIPIIVFTTSHNLQDIDSCYQSGVNSYVTKPIDIKAFNRAISTIFEYWLKIAHLP